MRSVCSSSTSMRTPSPLSTLPITWTSEMLGTLVSVVAPGASSVAAMSFNAEFFAPETSTAPSRACPPWTRMMFTKPPFTTMPGTDAAPGMARSHSLVE